MISSRLTLVQFLKQLTGKTGIGDEMIKKNVADRLREQEDDWGWPGIAEFAVRAGTIKAVVNANPASNFNFKYSNFYHPCPTSSINKSAQSAWA